MRSATTDYKDLPEAVHEALPGVDEEGVMSGGEH